MKLGFMGIDQHGNYYHIDKFPRKELLNKLGFANASKMYVDNTKTNQARHCGYVIGGLWINVYEVHSWN